MVRNLMKWFNAQAFKMQMGAKQSTNLSNAGQRSFGSPFTAEEINTAHRFTSNLSTTIPTQHPGIRSWFRSGWTRHERVFPQIYGYGPIPKR